MMATSQPIPVSILGGFLGAGKTTVLNHILSSAHGRRIGVIVNDFGEINIDHKLVVGVDGDTIDLANGCVCCTLRDNFVVSLQQLLHRRGDLDHVIIEASGVSDPAAIADGFEAPGIRDVVRLDAVLVVVDAEHFGRMRTSERIVAGGQIRAADVVILNKADLVDPSGAGGLDELERRVRKMVPRARVLAASHGQIPSELFFDLGQHVVDRSAASRVAGAAPHTDFETWSFATPRPLSSRRLRKFIERLPPEIYRAKGVVRLVRDRGRRAILHVVGRRAELQLGEPWGNDPPRSELVFLGTRGALDSAQLAAALEGCVGGAAGTEAPTMFRWIRSLWDHAART